jgi:hypothetical protein
MGLKEALEEKKYDRRLVNRAVDKGFPEPDGYTQALLALEDDTEYSSFVTFEEIAGAEKG